MLAKAGIPDKVDINGTHCASKNYSVSPLWIVNSLMDIEATTSIMHQIHQFQNIKKLPSKYMPKTYFLRIRDFQGGSMWGFNCY